MTSGAGRKVEPEPEPELEPEPAAASPSVLHLLTTETHPDMLALVFKNLKGSDLCGISQVPTHPSQLTQGYQIWYDAHITPILYSLYDPLPLS